MKRSENGQAGHVRQAEKEKKMDKKRMRFDRIRVMIDAG